MTTTKIRTIIATLAAAFTVAVAVAPAAHAQIKTKNKTTQTSPKAQVTKELCAIEQASLQQNEEEAGKRAGTKAAAPYAKAADAAWEAGEKLGCSWAA